MIKFGPTIYRKPSWLSVYLHVCVHVYYSLVVEHDTIIVVSDYNVILAIGNPGNDSKC